MADPVTWFTALTLTEQLLVGATVVAVGAAAYSGYTTVQTADFNEKMARQEAEYQRQLGVANERRQRRALAKAQGEIGVQAAGAGVSLLSGSIMDAFTESQKEGALDAIMIRTGAKNAQRGALVKAEQFDFAGDATIVSTGLDIASTSLSGASKVSGGISPGGSGKLAGADRDY